MIILVSRSDRITNCLPALYIRSRKTIVCTMSYARKVLPLCKLIFSLIISSLVFPIIQRKSWPSLSHTAALIKNLIGLGVRVRRIISYIFYRNMEAPFAFHPNPYSSPSNPPSIAAFSLPPPSPSASTNGSIHHLRENITLFKQTFSIRNSLSNKQNS